MDESALFNGVLRAVLGGRRRRSGRALRYLTGGRRSLWASPQLLLSAAGLAWGIFETMQGRGDASSQAPQGLASTGVGLNTGGPQMPPPLPNAAAEAGLQRAPHGGPATGDALRLVRLALSAAQADGVMNDQERAAVVARATEAGVAGVIERELLQRPPLAEIVRGVTDPVEKATLYSLAFAIARADEHVGGAERIYLAQLANLLGLDPPTVQQLEQDAGTRIDATSADGE